jgi:RNA polymerase sporulation-specific sigma factor
LSLNKALQKLDRRSREIIFLRYFKEETQQMVAEKNGNFTSTGIKTGKENNG